MADRETKADAVVTPPTWFVYSSLLGGHAAFNLWLSPIGTGIDTSSQAGAYVVNGVISCQAFLLGMWAGVGPGKLISRLPTTLAAQVLLVFASCIRRWRLVVPVLGQTFLAHLNVQELVAGLGVLMFTCLITHVAGRTKGRKILRAPYKPNPEDERRQFSIRYLLAMMAVCGILLTIARQIGFDFSLDLRWGQLFLATLFASVVGGFLVLPTMVLSSLLLSRQIRSRRYALYIIGAFLASSLVMLFISFAMSGSMELALRQLLPVQFGAIAAGLLSAWPLRLSGYRFVRLRSGVESNPIYLSQSQL